MFRKSVFFPAVASLIASPLLASATITLPQSGQPWPRPVYRQPQTWPQRDQTTDYQDRSLPASDDFSGYSSRPTPQTSQQEDGYSRTYSAPPASTADQSQSYGNSQLQDVPRLLDALIKSDAAHWYTYSYRAGSINNIQIVAGSIPSGNFILHAQYVYDTPISKNWDGWVNIKVSGAALCLNYWDDNGNCRAPYDENTPSYSAYVLPVLAVVGGLYVAGKVVGGGASSSASVSDGEAERHRHYEEQQQKYWGIDRTNQMNRNNLDAAARQQAAPQ